MVEPHADGAYALRCIALTPEIVFGDVDGNLDRIAHSLDEAGGRGRQLIVATELATSGYVFTDRDEAAGLAMTRDDPRWDRVTRRLGAGTVAVVGFCETLDGELYNSAAVLSRGGVDAVYRKSHLWADEKKVFRPGPSAGLVVDTAIGRVGVAICYDNEFPEVPRRLALAGADVLALPVNWPLVARPDGERAPELIQAMAAARSSRLPTVIADRTGTERGVVWTGGTAVIDGDGWIVASGDGPFTAADVAVAPGHKALGELNDLFADRRIDLYG
ncbi:nitrilase-related carbon-nitrogen hydrolase [Microbacterium oleivorans]|uniref:Carbon-nitrogen hydrolase n=1 Tax=Microbacterium oleivorans TaxID=273677 RepID=A0A7D5ITE8_9MICO|nr:nitrilase-related carbon-nitrogen hydrolase [Microbacterium oleivorans]QLD12297.1 carbon-nitrogen hydrolase [Microbacterium oleivorans]